MLAPQGDRVCILFHWRSGTTSSAIALYLRVSGHVVDEEIGGTGVSTGL